MPVIFKCECGKYLCVRNKYIKRKLRCVCGKLLVVPSPNEPDISIESDDKYPSDSHPSLIIPESLSNSVKETPREITPEQFSLDSGKRCQHCGARLSNIQNGKCSLCGLQVD